jgi:hypothetical protein
MELEVYVGDSFDTVALKAKEILNNSDNVFVQFDFNGVKCVVTAQTNPECLYRDYQNSLSYNIPEFATGTEPEYSPEIQTELQLAIKAKEKRQKAAQKKAEAEEKRKIATFNKKVEGIDIELYNPLAWKMWRENNKDGYGNGIMTFAENWAKLMQVEMASEKSLKDIASSTSHEADLEGITGFMYGAAVKVLSDSWKFGETLRRWHNKEYNHDGDAVVNVAAFSIG